MFMSAEIERLIDKRGTEMTKRKSQTCGRARYYLLLLMCVLGVMVTNQGAIAQVDQGTITGTVQDSTGAIIPAAKVTVKNIDTGLVLEGTSNGAVSMYFPL